MSSLVYVYCGTLIFMYCVLIDFLSPTSAGIDAIKTREVKSRNFYKIFYRRHKVARSRSKKDVHWNEGSMESDEKWNERRLTTDERNERRLTTDGIHWNEGRLVNDDQIQPDFYDNILRFKEDMHWNGAASDDLQPDYYDNAGNNHHPPPPYESQTSLHDQINLTPVLSTKYGKVRGFFSPSNNISAGGGVSVYLGIPYATPPVDSNRLTPTRAPNQWQVRDVYIFL